MESKKQEIAELGGDTTRLGEQIRQLILEKRQIQSQVYNWKQKFNEIQSKIVTANELRNQADGEVERLKALLAQQDTIITDQKKVIVLREDSIVKINNEKAKLAEKVAIGSVLRVDAFKIEGLNTKGKVDADGEFKAKKVDKLKISFTLGDNKLADKGGRDMFVRVIEPDGAALFDLANAGGSFQFQEKEMFYTYKQNILFDNSKQTLTFEYKKGSIYKVGVHKVEVYCEGNKIGEGSFKIKK